MVRFNGQVMTEVRYQELQQEVKADRLTVQQRLNDYFFGETEISRGDWLWFYGSMIGMAVLTVLVCLPSWLGIL